jgi:hypothetical protein
MQQSLQYIKKICNARLTKFYSNRLHIQNTSELPTTNLLKVAKLGKTTALPAAAAVAAPGA